MKRMLGDVGFADEAESQTKDNRLRSANESRRKDNTTWPIPKGVSMRGGGRQEYGSDLISIIGKGRNRLGPYFYHWVKALAAIGSI